MINQVIVPKFIWRIGFVMYCCALFIFCQIIFNYNKMLNSTDKLFFILFSLVPWIINYLRYLYYKATFFVLVQDGVVHKTRFIFHIDKKIRFSDIKEVTLYRGPMQRYFNVGTVIVATNVTATARPEIVMFNIKEYEEVYKYLTEKVHK